MNIEFEDDEGVVHLLPAKYAVCPTCRGKGYHVNPAIDGNGISMDEFREDPDFFEEYMSGVYDVKCYECEGKRVVKVVDEERCDKILLKQYFKMLDDEWWFQQEVAAEKRFGA